MRRRPQQQLRPPSWQLLHKGLVEEPGELVDKNRDKHFQDEIGRIQQAHKDCKTVEVAAVAVGGRTVVGKKHTADGVVEDEVAVDVGDTRVVADIPAENEVVGTAAHARSSASE